MIKYSRLSIALALLLVTGAAWAQPAILVMGDSLSAAYGINPKEGWVTLLQQRLQQNGNDYQVINASVSGETTSGGLSRLPAALDKHFPSIVIIELGANDGLRGQPLPQMRDNLQQMIQLAQSKRAKVLLIGMQLPPNYGPRYTQQFQQTYDELANKYKLPLVPFLMDGIALNRSMLQPDGLHPTAQAQPVLLDNVWPSLQKML